MGRNNKRRIRQLQPAASQCIKGAGAKPQMEKTLEELRKVLFRPLIFNSSSGRTIDFEHIQIPFLLKGSHLYTVMFMDGCGDTSVYTECYELEDGNPFESYKDATELMREALEIEKTTGIPYYFGKLDKALETYLYGLQLFVDKEMLDRDKAVGLARDLGFDTEAMLDMHQAVSSRIEETMKRREQRMQERKEQKTAADIMMQFLSDIMEAGEEGETRPMKQIKPFMLALILCLSLCLTGCGVTDIVSTFKGNEPTAEELLAKVPKISLSDYNQFHLSMEITAGTQDGDSRKFTMSGSFETWDRISHVYNVKAEDTGTGYSKDAVEGWTDYHTLEAFINQGEGWSMGKAEHPEALANLETAINSRQGARILEMDSSTCTVSWEFLTDSTSLFGTFLKQDAGSTQLSGKGRVTAVFDPKTFEFQYFTVVISAGDNTLSVTLLDMVLYWDTKNSTQHALVIPDTIQADAYKASTGVSSNGGYDEMVNPLAEELIEVYGGTADVTHYEDGSSLFWTLEKEGQSVTINYIHEEDPVTRFEDSYEFLVSFYGEPVEETEDGAYFYSSGTGELAYMARGEDWYAEIIITGPAESTQGQLRKPLITYKSKLGI